MLIPIIIFTNEVADCYSPKIVKNEYKVPVEKSQIQLKVPNFIGKPKRMVIMTIV
jgi:hypothetical protein